MVKKGGNKMYALHEMMLSNYGLSLWDVLTLVVGVIMIIVFVVHRNNQKKRRKEFEEQLAEKIQEVKMDLASKV